jgi:hypothetical protein
MFETSYCSGAQSQYQLLTKEALPHYQVDHPWSRRRKRLQDSESGISIFLIEMPKFDPLINDAADARIAGDFAAVLHFRSLPD